MREIDLEGHIYDRTKTMKDDQWRVQIDLVIEVPFVAVFVRRGVLSYL